MEGEVGDFSYLVKVQQLKTLLMVKATVLELERGMKASLDWS